MDNDFSIFQNQKDVVANIENSSTAIGGNAGNLEKIKSGRPNEFMVAKKNCRQCNGRGVVDFVSNKKKEFKNTQRKENRVERKDEMTKAMCRCVKIQME